MLTETGPEQGLNLHDLKKMEESKLLHFSFFWLSFKSKQAINLTKKTQALSNWWKQMYLYTYENEENNW